jgi:hypothetical protein
MRYEWDERKNRENQRKHGILFEVAALVFKDQNCFIELDRVDEAGEQMWHALGRVRPEPEIDAVLLVAHVYREDLNGEEIIRIISARRADKHDVRRYRAQAVD